MIKVVQNEAELKMFVNFTKNHYNNDPFYVPPIYKMFTKELDRLILKEHTYKALLQVDEEVVKGRILYTIATSKQEGKDVCYFSNFESVQDNHVAEELFSYMEQDVKDKVDYIEGSFSPYDPDTRRGILVEGFSDKPSLFTSYNKKYYDELLSNVGYSKKYDTVAVEAELNEKYIQKIKKISTFFNRRHEVTISSFDKSKWDHDVSDIADILKAASTDVIYQDAPDAEELSAVAKQLKVFLDFDLIKIARESSGRPIGFCFSVLDYNQYFYSSKGKMNIVRFLLYKKKISRVKGQLQYVIPEYQGTGLIAALYDALLDEYKRYPLNLFEAGTIMEENSLSIDAIKRFGGSISKRYRLYGKELKK